MRLKLGAEGQVVAPFRALGASVLAASLNRTMAAFSADGAEALAVAALLMPVPRARSSGVGLTL